MKFRFPIVIIDEDYRSENTSGLGIRALADAIVSEGFEVLGVTSYGDLSQFAQQQSRASAFILSIDDEEFTPGPDLDPAVVNLRAFIEEHHVQVFSEALAWSADDAPLFINLPIPSTQAAVAWTADRITQVQDALGLRIGIRNVTHRMAPSLIEMNEAEFISAVVKKAGCSLHLDLHALTANSVRFGFDAQAFLQALPLSCVDYVRVGREYALLGEVLTRTHRRVARCVDEVKQLSLEAVAC